MQPIQNARKRFHCLRAIAARIVEQNDAAIVPLLFHPLQDDVRAGLRPILRIDVFQNHEIIEIFRDFQRSQFSQLRRTRIGSVRRAKQCGGATGNRFEQKLCGIQLQPDMLGPAERQVGMVIGVVPDLVSFVDDATNKPRVTFRVHPDDEKRGLYVCRFQDVQNLRRPSRIGAVVKSDCDLMLAARALVIKRREFRKLHILRREIAVCIHRQIAQSVGAILVHGDDFAVADVRYRVRRFYQFQRLTRLIVELEIARNV